MVQLFQKHLYMAPDSRYYEYNTFKAQKKKKLAI